MTYVGWIASALNVAGLWFLPRRKYLALACYAASSVCFVIWGVYTRAWNVIALQILLLALNIRTYIIWRQHGT